MRSVSIAATATMLVVAGFISSVHAGECPVDQRQEPGDRAQGPADYRDVTGGVTGDVPLDGFAGLGGRKLRIRRIEVAAGGIVGWHNHADRPALATIIAGEITEFRADCKVGIRHQAGDTVKETIDVAHWWKNETAEPASLLLADIAR